MPWWESTAPIAQIPSGYGHSVFLSAALWEAIAAEQQRTGENRSQVIARAVAALLRRLDEVQRSGQEGAGND